MRKGLLPPVLVFVAVLVTGCGAGSAAVSARGGGSIPAGADKVSADVPVFVTLDSSFGGQWDALQALLDKFPSSGQLTAKIEKSLASSGIDYEKDVAGTIGPELDVAIFDLQDAGAKAVFLTQPKDRAGFEAALKKASKPPVVRKEGDWVLFAEDQATLDAYDKLGTATLSSDGDFKDAFDSIDGEALARVYADGPSLQKKLPSSVPQGTPSARWVAAAAAARDDGLLIDAYLKTDSGQAENFDSSLLDKVPAGAFLALAFDGKSFGLEKQFDALRKSPGIGGKIGQFETFTGIDLADLVAILDGQGVLYARAGAPIPEVTLLVKDIDVDRAVQTVDAIATKLTKAAAQPEPQPVTIDGVGMRRVTVQGIALTYGKVDGMLVVTTGANTVQDLRAGGSGLTDSDEFKSAQHAAGISGDIAGLLYADVPDLVSMYTLLSQLTGAVPKLPSHTAENAQHLRSILLTSHADDENTVHAVAFVHVQ